MIDDRDFWVEQGKIVDEITDLSDEEYDYLEYANTYGLPMLKLLQNFTLNVPDILDINFGTTEAILRYFRRLRSDSTFKDQIGYIGIYF